MGAFAPLPLFSKVLFYTRENYPEDISPRSRDLLLGALDAIAQEDRAIVVEREPDSPPRWVTLTVEGESCTLNIDRVDAPWSLRSALQQAVRFVQGRLATAPGADVVPRLGNPELAAIDGMLSTLDRHSRLFDAENYRKIRGYLGSAAGARPGALRAQDFSKSSRTAPSPWAALFPRIASGQTIGRLRLPGFPPGVSSELEKSLLALEAVPPKGFILDLRDNSGGLLEEAVKVADAFIKVGTLGPSRGNDSARTTSRTPTATSPAAR